MPRELTLKIMRSKRTFLLRDNTLEESAQGGLEGAILDSAGSGFKTGGSLKSLNPFPAETARQGVQQKLESQAPSWALALNGDFSGGKRRPELPSWLHCSSSTSRLSSN
jgi:hypothetical protein